MHLFITCKVGEVPCVNELKKGLGDEISYLVEFVEGTDEKDFEYLGHDSNCDNNTSLTTVVSKATHPACGDAIYIKEDSPDDHGTLGIFTVKDDHSMKHYAVTCFHVCYNGGIPFRKDRCPHEWHQILHDDSKNNGSRTRQTKYWYRHRTVDDKNYVKHEEKVEKDKDLEEKEIRSVLMEFSRGKRMSSTI